MFENLCVCGHDEEEHEATGFFKRCEVEDCSCEDFEPAEEDE